MSPDPNTGLELFCLRIAPQLLNKITLIVQQSTWPTPLDVRDSVEAYESNQRITTLFQEFAERVNGTLFSTPIPSAERTMLAALNLGDSYAENEEAQLERYYLERDEFRQVLAGRVNIIIGRKGSGKTAVFVRARDVLKSTRANVVVDLNPETHQLLKLKDLIIKSLSEGSKEHLLKAFLEYVLLLEVCSKILDKDRDVHKRNHQLFEPYQRLLKFYGAETTTICPEFSERLAMLITRVAHRYIEQFGERNQVILGEPQVTNLLYAAGNASRISKSISVMMSVEYSDSPSFMSSSSIRSRPKLIAFPLQ